MIYNNKLKNSKCILQSANKETNKGPKSVDIYF